MSKKIKLSKDSFIKFEFTDLSKDIYFWFEKPISLYSKLVYGWHKKHSSIEIQNIQAIGSESFVILPSIQYEHELEDLWLGLTREKILTKRVICNNCQGCGCATCDGFGYLKY